MRAIVTVLGKDKSGIIAKVSTLLASNDINIEDISQTVIQGNFTMIMLVSLDGSKLNIGQLCALLKEEGERIGVNIHVQNEEIFDAIHKI